MRDHELKTATAATIQSIERWQEIAGDRVKRQATIDNAKREIARVLDDEWIKIVFEDDPEL